VFSSRPGTRAHNHQARLDPEDQTGSAGRGAWVLCRRDRGISLGSCWPVAACRTFGDLSRVGRDAWMARTRLVRDGQRSLCGDHAAFLGSRFLHGAAEVFTNVSKRTPAVSSVKRREQSCGTKLASASYNGVGSRFGHLVQFLIRTPRCDPRRGTQTTKQRGNLELRVAICLAARLVPAASELTLCRGRRREHPAIGLGTSGMGLLE